jgi:hypothetical protein
MRTFAILIIAMVLTSTFAVQMKKPSLATLKKIESLQGNRKSWSSIVINLAMLHAKAGGPLDELTAAIEKVVADLAEKLEKATSDFDARTGEHNNEVKRLSRESDNARADIAHTTTFLREVLYVMKTGFEQDIVDLQNDIESTRRFLTEIALQRENEHNDFVAKVEDHEGAISAISECFELLQTLLDGGSSLAQVNKAKTAMTKLQKKLKTGIDATLVKALVQLATAGFSDSALIRKVMDKMHEVQDSLRESLEKLNADEEQAQEDYENLVKQKESEIRGYEAEQIEKKGQLEATIRRIEQNEAFLSTRESDLAEYQDQAPKETQDRY